MAPETEFDLDVSKKHLDKLLEICRRPGRVLVLMQNNPDPDALASALAVRFLVRALLHKRAIMGYGGVLGRAENRAMVGRLKIDLKHVTPASLERFKTICLVDTQPGAGNNALFVARPADVVIDHHIPGRKKAARAPLHDVRPEYGATSTILCEYLRAADMTPDTKLATALYYGITTDTQDLGREASKADVAAVQELIALADPHELAQIRRAPVAPAYFAALQAGIANAEVAGRTVLTLVRQAADPDMFAEVADLMLRLDGVRTSVCYGPLDGIVYISARAVDARGQSASRMQRTVRRIGTGGGHRSMAGGQVPIEGDLEQRLALVRERILRVYARDHEAHPLIPSAAKEDGEA